MSGEGRCITRAVFAQLRCADVLRPLPSVGNVVAPEESDE